MSCCGSGSLSVGPGEEGEGTGQRVGGQHDLSGPQPSIHQHSLEAKPPLVSRHPGETAGPGEESQRAVDHV